MKVAVSVPNVVFDAADRLAADLRVSRSQLYSQALAAYLESQGGAAVTARLNAVYDGTMESLDPAWASAQSAAVGNETW